MCDVSRHDEEDDFFAAHKLMGFAFRLCSPSFGGQITLTILHDSQSRCVQSRNGTLLRAEYPCAARFV